MTIRLNRSGNVHGIEVSLNRQHPRGARPFVSSSPDFPKDVWIMSADGVAEHTYFAASYLLEFRL